MNKVVFSKLCEGLGGRVLGSEVGNDNDYYG